MLVEFDICTFIRSFSSLGLSTLEETGSGTLCCIQHHSLLQCADQPRPIYNTYLCDLNNRHCTGTWLALIFTTDLTISCPILSFDLTSE